MWRSRDYETVATRRSDRCRDPNLWIQVFFAVTTVLFAALFGGYYSAWHQAAHCEREFASLYFEPQCRLESHVMCWTGRTVTYGVEHECTEYWKSARLPDQRRRLLVTNSGGSVGAGTNTLTHTKCVDGQPGGTWMKYCQTGYVTVTTSSTCQMHSYKCRNLQGNYISVGTPTYTPNDGTCWSNNDGRLVVATC
jgi:hypothetical protein